MIKTYIQSLISLLLHGAFYWYITFKVIIERNKSNLFSIRSIQPKFTDNMNHSKCIGNKLHKIFFNRNMDHDKNFNKYKKLSIVIIANMKVINLSNNMCCYYAWVTKLSPFNMLTMYLKKKMLFYLLVH